MSDTDNTKPSKAERLLGYLDVAAAEAELLGDNFSRESIDELAERLERHYQRTSSD